MNNDQRTSNGTVNIDWWKKSAFPVVLAAAIGALLGGPGYRAMDNQRQDSYTGSEASRDKKILRSEIASVKSDFQIVTSGMSKVVGSIETRTQVRLDGIYEQLRIISATLANRPPKDLIAQVSRIETELEWLKRVSVKWQTGKEIGSEN